ncbi:MAG: hypothetical protein WCP96_00130 [Methylococcaceae bacterium]
MKRVKILIPVISAFILSCICFFIFYLINNTYIQENLSNALYLGFIAFVLVAIFFNLQLIRDLPHSQRFVNFYFPLVATGTLAAIILHILKGYIDNSREELFLTLVFVLLGGVIIYFLQERFYSYAFTPALSTFIKVSSQKHPVTQKFAAELLMRFLDGYDIENLKAIFTNTTSTANNVNNIGELIIKLETASKRSGGIFMNEADYSFLLTLSLEFNPQIINAMWDTEMIPIDGEIKDKYIRYFNELLMAYKKTSVKTYCHRIFIFKDIAEYEACKVNPNWDTLKKLHKDWGFTEIYYCCKKQFNDIKKNNIPDTVSHLLDDFVIYSISDGFKWVICRDKDKKVYLIHNNNTIFKETNTFYELLIQSCKEHSRTIPLP